MQSDREISLQGVSEHARVVFHVKLIVKGFTSEVKPRIVLLPLCSAIAHLLITGENMTMLLGPQFGRLDNDRPVPERVAQQYSFPLAFHDVDGIRWYSVQDWISGIVPDSEVRKLWSAMKRRNPQLSTSCRQLKYRARDGKTYSTSHADAETLYMITQRLEAHSGNRDAVLTYLAKAGVLLDEMVRNPAAAEIAFADLDETKEYRKLIREGYSPAEAEQWLQVRRDQKAETKRLNTEWRQRGVARPIEYARLTNEVHQTATGETATAAKMKMRVKRTSRDYQSAADNVKIQIVSMTSRMLHQQRDSEGVEELSDDIGDVKPIIDAARSEIDRVFSQKPRRLPRGKPSEHT